MTPYLRLQLVARRAASTGTACGLLLSIASVALIASCVMQAMSQRCQAKKDTVDAIAQATPLVVSVSDGDEERLDAFRRLLSLPASGDDEISSMFKAAGSSQLQIAEAEYRTEPDPSHEFRRLTVSLPVTGSYPQVRSFLFTLLSENPSTALTDVSFKREKQGFNVVTANLRFTLYQRAR